MYYTTSFSRFWLPAYAHLLSVDVPANCRGLRLVLSKNSPSRATHSLLMRYLTDSYYVSVSNAPPFSLEPVQLALQTVDPDRTAPIGQTRNLFHV